MMSTIHPPKLGPTTTLYVIADNGLNLRSGAGTEHPIIYAIPYGEPVSFVANHGDWAEVTHEGQSAYAYAQLLGKKPDRHPPRLGPPPDPWIGYVTAPAGLRLRADYSLDADIIATIELGERIVINDQRGDWLAATYGTMSGYVAAKWVSQQKPDTGQDDDRNAIVAELAAEYGVDERVAHAVIKIESGGAGFRDGRLVIRFEPHIFKARFNALFQEYFQMGDPAWDGNQHRVNVGGEWRTFHGDQDKEYQAQEIATLIAERAALESASYGAGQIMGFNYRACGYDSAGLMLTAFEESEEAQLRAMFEFWRNRGALEPLRAGNYVEFARIYNGPGQAQHYANLIQQELGQ